MDERSSRRAVWCQKDMIKYVRPRCETGCGIVFLLFFSGPAPCMATVEGFRVSVPKIEALNVKRILNMYTTPSKRMAGVTAGMGTSQLTGHRGMFRAWEKIFLSRTVVPEQQCQLTLRSRYRGTHSNFLARLPVGPIDPLLVESCRACACA